MNWPILGKPPIREAVCDLRFTHPQSITIEKLKEFCDKFKTDFPKVNQIFSLKMEVQAGSTEKAGAKGIVYGYRLSNEKKSFILQLRLDGITISKLAPYISWEEVRQETKLILEKLFSFFGSITFSRIALRYINDFNIRLTETEPLISFILILPYYPKQLPQQLEGFSIQLLMTKRELDIQGVVNFMVGHSDPNTKDVIRVIFDIDVFRQAQYSHLDAILSELEILRDFKNEIFFSSTTERLQSQFK